MAPFLLGKLEPCVVEVRVEFDFFYGDPEDLRPALGLGFDQEREDEPVHFPEIRERVFQHHGLSLDQPCYIGADDQV